MPRLATRLAVLVSISALWSAPSLAYIGPGAGITLFGAIWGVIVAIAVTLGAIVLWPFRIFMRRRRKRAAKPADAAAAEAGESATIKPEPGRD